MDKDFTFLSDKFKSDDFWKQRENAVKSKLIMYIIDYCDIYDIMHKEVFNADSVKRELTELIDFAIDTFVKDN